METQTQCHKKHPRASPKMWISLLVGTVPSIVPALVQNFSLKTPFWSNPNIMYSCLSLSYRGEEVHIPSKLLCKEKFMRNLVDENWIQIPAKSPSSTSKVSRFKLSGSKMLLPLTLKWSRVTGFFPFIVSLTVFRRVFSCWHQLLHSTHNSCMWGGHLHLHQGSAVRPSKSLKHHIDTYLFQNALWDLTICVRTLMKVS